MSLKGIHIERHTCLKATPSQKCYLHCLHKRSRPGKLSKRTAAKDALKDDLEVRPREAEPLGIRRLEDRACL